ncbi:DUF599 domain-containing protein [Acrasis kona]|uniref:DUF599 domain-containing protein n=1 Tax=Acrasis kona TaxID=1008807 RepID=A0AAW2YTK6_9EUKA
MNSTITNDLLDVFSSPKIISDVIAVLFVIFAMLIYYLTFTYYERKYPYRLLKGYRNQLRRIWVSRMLKDEKNYILVVQTMRNEIMIASFLASTAVIICMGFFERTHKISRFRACYQIIQFTWPQPPHFTFDKNIDPDCMLPYCILQLHG